MAYNGLRTEPEDTFTDPHSHDKATRGESSLLTEANLGKHCSSGSRPSTRGGRSVKSGTSRSSKTSLSERRRRKKELALLAENAPRPWPDPDVYELRSLFCMTLQNPIRRAAIAAIEWPKRGSSFWDKKVLFVIGLNTITMAMYDCFDKPSMRACDPAETDIPPGPYGYCNKMGTGKYFPQYIGRDLQDIIGKIFSAYFTIELIVKVVAQGFVLGSKTYLSEGPNWLDVFIVGAGLLDFVPTDAEGGGGASSLRALRVLRPLRAVKKFPKLMNLVVLLGLCIAKLTTATAMNLFIFLVFGILGTQLFKGALKGRCFNIETGQIGDSAQACSLGAIAWSNPDDYWVRKDMDVTSGTHSGGAFLCAAMQEECLQLGSNPGNGSVGFDSIGLAMMSIFELFTMGWAGTCYAIIDTVGYWNWLFFVAIIMLGPMFCLQLFLVVICNRSAEVAAEQKEAAAKVKAEAEELERIKEANEKAEAEEHERQKAEKEEKKRRRKEANAQANAAANGRDKVGPTEAWAVSTDEKEGNQHEESEVAQTEADEDSKPQKAEGAQPLDNTEQPTGWHKFTSQLQGYQAKLRVIAFSEGLGNIIMAVILMSTAFMAADGLCEYEPAECAFSNACLFSGQSCARYKGTLEFVNLVFTIIFVFELTVKIGGLGLNDFFRGEGSGMNIFDAIIVANSCIEFSGGLESGICFFDRFQGTPTEDTPYIWPPGSTERMDRLVTVEDMFGTDTVFGLCAIAPMEISPAWKDSLLKIPRLIYRDGKWQYNPMMHLFCSGGGGAAVLRALRLVRLVKLLRRFPEITKQFKILGEAMASLAALLVLIVIMLFIFTILGMNLLGGSVHGDWPPNKIEVGAEVYLTVPWDENGGRPRHGKVHWFDYDNHPRAPYKVELEFGGPFGGGGGWDPITNVSVGRVLDDHGFIWAATIDDPIIGVPQIMKWTPRFNFDNLGVAFLTAYSIFTVANWNERLYEVMGSGQGIGFSFFFYALIIIGNWIILNLFISILIGKFTEQRALKLEQNTSTMKNEFLDRILGLEGDALNDELLKFFREIDMDGSGEIDKEEFNQALLKIGVELKPPQLDKLMFDVTGRMDGIIHFEEFVLMMKRYAAEAEGGPNVDVKEELALAKKAKKEAEEHEMMMEALGAGFLEKLGDLTEEALDEKLQEIFNENDLDGSGEVDKEEFNKMLINLGVTMQPRFLDKLIIEQTGDATIVKISVEVFKIMIGRFLKEAKDKKAAEEEAAREASLQAINKWVGGEVLPNSCFCIPQHHPIRVFCFMLINEDKKAFGGGWRGRIGPEAGRYFLACILLSTVQLAIFTPWVGTDSRMTAMLDIWDILLNISFTIELVAKFIALGWTRFIKPGWNKLDLFIVGTSDIDMTLTYALKGQDVPLSALRIFRVFRIFRALRPLRIIARAKSIRMLVGTMLSAVKPVSTTLVIACGLMFVMGIFFVQFLGGRIKSCTDHTKFTRPECRGLDDSGSPRLWLPPVVNFDNIWNAWYGMFTLATEDDWPAVMWNAVDGTGSLTALKQGGTMNAFLGAFIVIIAVLTCSAIVINMFVGVFVDCYYGAQAEVAQDSDGRTPPLKKKLLDDIYEDPTTGLKGRIFAVVTESNFDIFIAFFIVANVLSMATDSFKPSDGQVQYDITSNYFFCFVFAFEMGFKCWALSPARYFASGWAKFDTFIVSISFLGIFIDNAAGVIDIEPSVLRILRIFRIFRILRAFRIFKAAKDLQNIVMALARSAQQVGNLLCLLMLLFFIFGVLATNIGGHMCVSGDESPPEDILENHPLYGVRCSITSDKGYLDKHAHFQGVGVALFTMWRVATGDGWGSLLAAASLMPGARIMSPDLNETWYIVTGTYPESLNVTALLDGEIVAEGYSGQQLTNMGMAVYALQMYNVTILAERAGGGGRRHGRPHALEAQTSAQAPKLDGRRKGGKGGGGDGEGVSGAAKWLQVAKFALPECLTEDEANFLSVHGLIDCTNPGDGYSAGQVMCMGTCGFNLAGLFYTSLIPRFYFLVFICISTFVLMQLVIGVLMDQMSQSEDDGAAGKELAPGCEVLTVMVFMRAYRRFSWNARRKLYCEAKHEHEEKENGKLSDYGPNGIVQTLVRKIPEPVGCNEAPEAVQGRNAAVQGRRSPTFDDVLNDINTPRSGSA